MIEFTMKGLSMSMFHTVRRGAIAAALIGSFAVPGVIAAAEPAGVMLASGNDSVAQSTDANSNNSDQTDTTAPTSGQSGSSSGGSSTGGSSFTGPSFNGGSSGGSLGVGSAADVLGRVFRGALTGS